jgi:mono/diheme cytochrome c family protein
MTHNPSEHRLSAGFAFSEGGGEELYANVCQGCHMPDGKGATGAGTYPSLAGDKALEAPGYPSPWSSTGSTECRRWAS